MKEEGSCKEERNVKMYIFINVEDDLHNRGPGNLYREWGREVTFQVTY